MFIPIYTPSISAGPLVYTVQLEPVFDTELSKWATWDNSTSEIDVYSCYGSIEYVLVSKWNISSIPDDATITNVSLSFYVNQKFVQGGSACGGRIKAMDKDPEFHSATDIFNDAKDGTTYHDGHGLYGDDYGRRVVNTTTDGKYNDTFDNTPITNLTSHLSDDWWSIGLYVYIKNAWNGCERLKISSDEGTYGMILWVEYIYNGPIQSNPSPSNGATDQSLTPTTCIDISHPSGEDMDINFYWWNGSAWNLYGHNNSVNNGTYCQTFDNASAPATTYQWRVVANDTYGNYSNATYSFTTLGVIPPQNVECSRYNESAISLTWTKCPNGTGTAWTVIRYQLGQSNPPTWSGGALGVNTTGESAIINGLSESSCYSFSLWTNYNDSDGNWTLSTRNTRNPCCTSGGIYKLCLRYENSTNDPLDPTINYNNLINLTKFNCSTHRLAVHYADYATEYYYINESYYVNTSAGNWTPCITINTTRDPLYFVMWWNWSIQDETWDGENCSCNYTNSYTRTLLPSAGTWDGNQTVIDFYFITDRHIYNDYYIADENCNYSVEYFITNNLVKYSFAFEDRSGIFTSRTDALDTYSSFYCYNSTKQLMIHQEYWDRYERVHPTLLYYKDYLVGVNCSLWQGRLYENIGLAPNKEEDPDIVEEIVINPRTNETFAFADIFTITPSWDTDGTGLYVYYVDSSGGTDTVNLTLFYKSNNTIAYTAEYSSNEVNFFYPTADQNETFITWINITHNTYGIIPTFSFEITPEISPIVTSGYINSILQDVFGNLPSNLEDPSETIEWHGIIIFVFGLIPLSLFGATNPGIASMGAGVSTLGVAMMISATAVIGIGIVLIFFGILMIWAGRNR